ncbi:hypothetical protein [Loktanella sp. D2R18]|uniref:hypothetical protein n=2 Tax=Rhodobacterales TaxID=204455 RepID=UPI000DEA89C8|nr:hypothetical protein [Loktanella sp. D2R18]
MDVKEVIRLSRWMTNFMAQAGPKFKQLDQNLANNSRQGQSAAPVQEHLDFITKTLDAWDTTELSSLQVMTLKKLEVYRFLGRHGAVWLNDVVKTQSYDIATLSTQVSASVKALFEASKQLQLASTALNNIGITADEYVTDAVAGRYRVAVIFKADASIDNVADLKKRVNDWHVTVTGIGNAVGETVDHTTVTGADTGSLMVFLGMTAQAALILAMISKSITVVAANILDLQIKAEELRSKRLTNDAMEQAFSDQQRDLKKEAIATAMRSIEPHLNVPLTTETRPKLELSIKNLLKFAEQGGEVDIETPVESSDELASDETVAAVTAELRAMVVEKRKADSDLKALTDQRHGHSSENKS